MESVKRTQILRKRVQNGLKIGLPGMQKQWTETIAAAIGGRRGKSRAGRW